MFNQIQLFKCINYLNYSLKNESFSVLTSKVGIKYCIILSALSKNVFILLKEIFI